MNDNFHKIVYRDGYSGSCRWWSGGDKGAVLYLHGIQSHGLWFEQSADALARLGFNVLLPDRRGSGRNEPARGDVRDYQQWISDHVELIKWLSEKTGYDRVHVIGVSWGGKIAMALARVLPRQIASLTLISPGIFPVVDVAWETKFKIAMAVIFRRKKYFPIPLNEPELFTGNPDRQEFIRQDPLRLTAVTGDFLYQSRRLDRFIRRIPERLAMPMKMFLAGRERIIDNQATIRYYRSLRTAGSKELILYDQACHTLEFEKDNRIFIRDLQEWLEHASNV